MENPEIQMQLEFIHGLIATFNKPWLGLIAAHEVVRALSLTGPAVPTVAHPVATLAGNIAVLDCEAPFAAPELDRWDCVAPWPLTPVLTSWPRLGNLGSH